MSYVRSFSVGEYDSDGVVLGTGATATVYLGRHRVSGELVAIKVIPLEPLRHNARAREMLNKEISVLLKAVHPNIVRLFHFVCRSSNRR
jgi:serine/threonine-protein kinase ULK2